MSEENTNVELEEQLTMFEDETVDDASSEESLDQDEAFKDAVYQQMRKIHNEGLVVGFQTACHTALNKIYAFERSAGKKSANDYKRCLKDLKQFFEIGISRKDGSDEVSETEESAEVETEQN